jgi:hypothetical protein
MSMTKKDYELVAKALFNQRDSIEKRIDIEYQTLDATIETMAAHFALMNEKFNKDTFLEWSGHGSCSND